MSVIVFTLFLSVKLKLKQKTKEKKRYLRQEKLKNLTNEKKPNRKKSITLVFH